MTGKNADGSTAFAVEDLTLSTLRHTDSYLVSEMCLDFDRSFLQFSSNLATVTGAEFEIVDLQFLQE